MAENLASSSSFKDVVVDDVLRLLLEALPSSVCIFGCEEEKDAADESVSEVENRRWWSKHDGGMIWEEDKRRAERRSLCSWFIDFDANIFERSEMAETKRKRSRVSDTAVGNYWRRRSKRAKLKKRAKLEFGILEGCNLNGPKTIVRPIKYWDWW